MTRLLVVSVCTGAGRTVSGVEGTCAVALAAPITRAAPRIVAVLDVGLRKMPITSCSRSFVGWIKPRVGRVNNWTGRDGGRSLLGGRWGAGGGPTTTACSALPAAG